MMDLSLASPIHFPFLGIILADQERALWSTVLRNILWMRLLSSWDGGSLNSASWSILARSAMFFSPRLKRNLSSGVSVFSGLMGADLVPVAASLATITNLRNT